MHRPSHTVAIRGLAVLTILGLSLVLGACGSSSRRVGGSSTGASPLGVGSSTAGASSKSLSSSNSARFRVRLDLAKCLRGHGIDVPAPSRTGVGGGMAAALENYPVAKLQGPLHDCRSYAVRAFPGLGLRLAPPSRYVQGLVRFAVCMVSHGIKVPDPASKGGVVEFRRALHLDRRRDSAFGSALAACRHLYPRHRLLG